MDPDRRVILFDVNQTLLDLGPLAPLFAETLGSPETMREWFARLLHGSLVANHLEAYRPFGEIGVDILTAMAKARGREVSPDRLAEVAGTIRQLPPHPEVPEALARLSAAGHRLAALTNSSPDALRAQMENAGLGAHFERLISVEEVGIYKPAPEPYRHALQIMEVEPGEAMMVAAHDWDVLGAQAVGIMGVFLARPGVVWSIPDSRPDLVAPDLAALGQAG